MKTKSFLLSLGLISIFYLSSSSQTLPTYVPASGLVGWWPYNGNANDESGNGNNGVVTGASLDIDRHGNEQSAYLFTDINQYINKGNSDDFNIFNADYSISVWCKPIQIVNEPDHSNQIITKYKHFSIPECDFFINLAGGGFIGHSGNGTNDHYEFAFNDNLWHHVVIVFEDGISSIFVDNSFLGSKSLNFNSFNSSTNLIVGSIDPSGPLFEESQFFGNLDDIGIWNRALTQEEISLMYSAIDVECTNLTSPVNGASNVNNTSDLSWAPSTKATGYKLKIGTTPGGGELLNNVDVGNVTTYDPPVNFPCNSEIFVLITPYNNNGERIGCVEESFTTRGFITRSNGEYSDQNTWEGGCVPPNPIPAGVTIEIGHELINSILNTIVNNGTIISTKPFNNFGTYKGNGTFIGPFINQGTLAPGN